MLAANLSFLQKVSLETKLIYLVMYAPRSSNDINSNKKRIISLVTSNKHQQQSVPGSCLDCFCLSGPACEFQRHRTLESSIGPLEQKTAVSLSVDAHQQVGDESAGEGSNTEDALLEVQSPEEGEGASSPHKKL